MEQPFRSTETRFYEGDFNCTLKADLNPRGWNFQIINREGINYPIVYEGSLRDTVELILLGKLMKDKMDNGGRVTIEETKAKEPMVCIEGA